MKQAEIYVNDIRCGILTEDEEGFHFAYDEAYLALAEQVLEDIVAKQGTDGVDTVSGATMSSRGILEAVDNALVGGAN